MNYKLASDLTVTAKNVLLNSSNMKAVAVAEVAEHLPSKHKALNSNPSTAKNKQRTVQT
jgi:hypothetical protein